MGFIQPLGAIFPIAEMQSRLIVKVFSGEVTTNFLQMIWNVVHIK